MTEKDRVRNRAKEIHKLVWNTKSNKDNKYLRFAQEQARQWAQESKAPSPISRNYIEDEILTNILNDNTYDYKSYVNDSYGEPEYMTTNNGGHFTDKYKTAYHPTFSNQSKYSGKVSNYNPSGIEGGSWEDNTYRLSKDQEDNNWDLQRTKDYLDEAERESIMLLSNSKMPIYKSKPKSEGGYYYNPFNEGSDIHIKPSHRGRLTALKQRTGKSEAELYRTGGPEVRKMITFARNARKWKHEDGGNIFDGNKSSQIPLIADRDFYIDNDGRFYYDNDKGTLMPSKETVMYYNPSYEEGDSTDQLKNYYVDRNNLKRVPKGSMYYQQSDGAIRFEPTIEIHDTPNAMLYNKDKPLQAVYPEFAALTAGRALANGAIDKAIEYTGIPTFFNNNPYMTKNFIGSTILGEGINQNLKQIYGDDWTEQLDHNYFNEDLGNILTHTGRDMLLTAPLYGTYDIAAPLSKGINYSLNLGKQGWNWINKNYIQPYRLYREIGKSNPVIEELNPITRTKLGDVEINNPQLAFRFGMFNIMPKIYKKVLNGNDFGNALANRLFMAGRNELYPGQFDVVTNPTWRYQNVSNDAKNILLSNVDRLSAMRPNMDREQIYDIVNNQVNTPYKVFPPSTFSDAGFEDYAGFYDKQSGVILKDFWDNPLFETHENRHALQDLLPTTKKEQAILNDAYGDLGKAILNNTGNWKYRIINKTEKETLNNDARIKLLGEDYYKYTTEQQNKLIDAASDNDIIESVRNADDYGFNLVEYYKRNGGVSASKIKAWREAMKKVGVVLSSGIFTDAVLSTASDQ